jgi:hypothetical protein
MHILIAIVILYVLVHLLFGHWHHRRRRRHGLSPNIYWSLARGPYASVRLPGGFRVGHRL